MNLLGSNETTQVKKKVVIKRENKSTMDEDELKFAKQMNALMRCSMLLKLKDPDGPEYVFQKLRVKENIAIIEEFLDTERDRVKKAEDVADNQQEGVVDSIEELDQKKLIVKNNKKKMCIFKPNDNFKSKWDIIIMSAAVFNCFTIPLGVAYNPLFMQEGWFAIFNNFIDFLFFLDILVTFRTAFIDSLGNEISEPCMIAKSYVCGQFLIDLLATIPID